MDKKKKYAIGGGIIALLLVFSMLFGGGDEEKKEAIDTTTEIISQVTFEETETAEETKEAGTEKEEEKAPRETSESKTPSNKKVNLKNIPEFSNAPYVVINDNEPYFNPKDYKEKYFEIYSPLDYLGRCTVAVAALGIETMPTEERGEIGMVRPSGWHTVKYDCVSGKYLYNRCHLIGFQLSAENANERNLITGTRYLNIEGMLPFENMVADYIKETNNHVLYRVTPIFKGNELVARGVQMEAYSVEDNGDGICFNVYCYNNQPGVIIDYETGDSELDLSAKPEKEETTKNKNDNVKCDYVLNTNSKKFHKPNCSSADKISPQNREEYKGTRAELIKEGYEPCKRCNP